MRIKNIKGEDIIVTDLKKAIEEAKQFVSWHRIIKAREESGELEEGEYYFKDAHATWEHNLKQLLILRDTLLFNDLKSKGWVQTDPSCNQYRKDIKENCFIFREDRIIDPITKEIEVYESKIDLSNIVRTRCLRVLKHLVTLLINCVNGLMKDGI